jgi:hypothetical protein
MTVPCRECEPCLKRRRSEWTARALSETRLAKRTWLCTLTLRPDEQYRAEVAAQRRAEQRGHNWAGLSQGQRHRHILAHLSREITLYLKRLRKKTGAKIRYLSISEQHKSGLPHFHLLVHEYDGIVRHTDLDDCWHLGFGNFKLVADDDPRAALYSCKYLAKATSARVRASLAYGSPPVAALRGSAPKEARVK